VNLTGWQAIAALLIAAALGVAGVVLERGGPLVSLATGIATGVFTLLQPWRAPQTRTRASDRINTAAGGHPLTPPPETFPPPRR
jgi:hypothetical protein